MISCCRYFSACQLNQKVCSSSHICVGADADTAMFSSCPSESKVRQGSIGDCWLISALSTVAASNPDVMRRRFVEVLL